MRASTSKSSAAPKVNDIPDWSDLLKRAVTEPGIISSAYSRFWRYSFGNQILAMIQCMARNINAGPIATYQGWHDLGRHVKRGERALTLCMPVTVKRKRSDASRGGDGAERQTTGPGGTVDESADTVSVTVFAYKPHWFVLSQTEGADYQPVEMPQWSEAQALHTLAIDRIVFIHPDGNCQGFAVGRSIAVSPIAALPHKTLLHELAHVVLGHTEEGNLLDDHDRTPRNLREVEAEAVAYLCLASLSLTGAAESRGYLQHWLGDQEIPDRSAQKIFKAADQILKAGYPAPATGPAEGTA